MFHHVPAGAHPLDFGALAFPGAHGLSAQHGMGHGHAVPHMQMDITETVEEFRVSADLPGFKKVNACLCLSFFFGGGAASCRSRSFLRTYAPNYTGGHQRHVGRRRADDRRHAPRRARREHHEFPRQGELDGGFPLFIYMCASSWFPSWGEKPLD